MKIIRSTKVTKMINRFDNELKALLIKDLNAIKEAKDHIVKSIHQVGPLSVA